MRANYSRHNHCLIHCNVRVYIGNVYLHDFLWKIYPGLYNCYVFAMANFIIGKLPGYPFPVVLKVFFRFSCDCDFNLISVGTCTEHYNECLVHKNNTCMNIGVSNI